MKAFINARRLISSVAKKTAIRKTKAGKAKANAKKAISAAVHLRRDAFGVTRSVTALCDAELIGSVLKSGSVGGCVIDLQKYKAFYSGELVDESRAAEIASQAYNLNVVGEKALAAARRAFEIRNVKRIAGVPHAQVYRV